MNGINVRSHICIHCGKPASIVVPIDDDDPGDSDVEICAWTCVGCVHKRVRFSDTGTVRRDGSSAV